MAAFNYQEFADLALELITECGREIKLYKLDATPADPSKPHRGPGVPTKTSVVTTSGVFIVPQTSIPTESRGLAFDWVNQDLLTRVREVCMTPAEGLPLLDDYKLILDEGIERKILWGQCLRPGPKRLLYVFGMIE